MLCCFSCGGVAFRNLGERGVEVLVVRPTLALAERCARFDDGVLDAGVAGVARFVRTKAHGAARFDDHVLDGAVMAIAEGGAQTASRAARLDDGVLDAGVHATSRGVFGLAQRSASVDGRWFDGAVEKVAAAVRTLGRFARAPQTGQLHQYYIQAVAVLAVGVLLLITVR